VNNICKLLPSAGLPVLHLLNGPVVKKCFFAPSSETTDLIKNVIGVQKWHGPPLSPCQVWWGSWVVRRL